MKICFALLLCLTLSLPSASWANGAPVLVRGIGRGRCGPIKNNQIRMVREVVDIDCASSTYTVQVDFWFKNTTDQAVELQMGFPVEYKTFFEDAETIQESCRSFKVEWKRSRFNSLLENFRKARISIAMDLLDGSFRAQRGGYEPRFLHLPDLGIDAGDKMDTVPYMYMKYILKTGATWADPIESSVVKSIMENPFQNAKRFFVFRIPPI
jgi:hypothetical protein